MGRDICEAMIGGEHVNEILRKYAPVNEVVVTA